MKTYTIILGSYSNSIGLLQWSPDAEPELITFPSNPNPSWLCRIDNLIFATQEDLDGISIGQIHSYILDENVRQCTLTDSQSSLGLFPCHIMPVPQRRELWLSNYMGGPLSCYSYTSGGRIRLTMHIPYKMDKNLKRLHSNPDRQEISHPHSCLLDSDGEGFFNTDLGCDEIRYYPFAHPENCITSTVPNGYGPRHLCMDKSGRCIYVICELQPVLLKYEKGPGGTLTMRAECRITGDEQANQCSELCLHPVLPFIYAANRQAGCVAQVRLKANGSLELVAEHSLAGVNPRHIAISPDGLYLFAALQDRDRIQILAIDQQNGSLNALPNALGGMVSFIAPSFIGFC